MKRVKPRAGFALLAVLWMLVGGATLAMLLMLTARDALGIATNRASLTQARWTAEGCIERARWAVDESAGEAIDDSAWMHLDRVVLASPHVRGCRLTVKPAGTALDVNAASDAQLRHLLITAGLPPVAADSLAAAILDWRDADDDPREAGAERAWYEGNGRIPPRNADIGSPEEMAAVRGLDRTPRVDTLLGVEHDPIFIARAPLPVLATLPGMSPPVLAAIEQRRIVGDSLTDLTRLAVLVDSASREALLANVATLAALTTTLPQAWLVTAEASTGHPPVTARLEIRVVRSGRRLAIMRRRSDS